MKVQKEANNNKKPWNICFDVFIRTPFAKNKANKALMVSFKGQFLKNKAKQSFDVIFQLFFSYLNTLVRKVLDVSHRSNPSTNPASSRPRSDWPIPEEKACFPGSGSLLQQMLLNGRPVNGSGPGQPSLSSESPPATEPLPGHLLVADAGSPRRGSRWSP